MGRARRDFIPSNGQPDDCFLRRDLPLRFASKLAAGLRPPG